MPKLQQEEREAGFKSFARRNLCVSVRVHVARTHTKTYRLAANDDVGLEIRTYGSAICINERVDGVVV